MSNISLQGISEKEREEIRKKAKKIMDSFAGELSRISKEIEEPAVEKGRGEREEFEGKCLEIDRKIMFENSPKKKGDFLVAEKRKW